MSRPVARKAAPKGEYIETDSGNKVSRRAAITGTANITLGGRTVIMADVHLRGDLHSTRSVPQATKDGKPAASGAGAGSSTPTAIVIGRCTVISTGTVIRPPQRVSRGSVHFYPMKIGDNVFIGPHCTISAIQISSHVHIGAHTTIHPFAMIKENVKILPHTVVPANMIIPPGSVVAGRPARVIGEVGEGWGVMAGGGLGMGMSGGGGGGTGGGEKGWVEGGDLRELVRSIK